MCTAKLSVDEMGVRRSETLTGVGQVEGVMERAGGGGGRGDAVSVESSTGVGEAYREGERS